MTCCNRAAGIVNAAARAVAGDELTLNDDYVPSVFAIALQQTAGELETLGDRALRPDNGAGRVVVDLGSMERRCRVGPGS